MTAPAARPCTSPACWRWRWSVPESPTGVRCLLPSWCWPNQTGAAGCKTSFARPGTERADAQSIEVREVAGDKCQIVPLCRGSDERVHHADGTAARLTTGHNSPPNLGSLDIDRQHPGLKAQSYVSR